MKQATLLSVLFILLGCGTNKEQDSKTASSTASNDNSGVTLALPVLYSQTWEVGDPQITVKSINHIKNWMAGDLANISEMFADSIALYLANGDKWIGARDSIVGMMKNHRELYSEFKADVHAIVPLRHRDTKENIVCIWLKEITTTKAGKIDSVEVQENWLFNDAGRIKAAYQFAALLK